MDLEAHTIFQDARTVRTKNRKTIRSFLFPIGEEIEAIVAEWVRYLRGELCFGADDPLFPATRVALAPDGGFTPAGLERRHWSNAAPIRRIFREAFEASDLPYFNPHSFRKTLARLGEQVCTSPEEFKAWSQNLGHDDVLTTFISYGAVAGHRQADIMEGLRTRGSASAPEEELDAETANRLVDYFRRRSGKG